MDCNRRSFALFPLAAALLLAGCSIPSVRVMPRVGLLELDGHIDTESGPLSASLSVDSLGLDDDEAVFMPRADLDWDPLHLSVEAFGVTFEGDGIAEAQIDLGGGTILVNAPVSSEAELNFTEVRLVYDLVPGALMDLGIGFGFGYLDYSLQIDEIGGLGGSVKTDDELPYGFLTARAGKSVGSIEGLVTLSGLSFEFEDDSYSFIDAEGMLIWTFYDTIKVEAELALGYRYISIDFELHDGISEVEFDIDVSGPFFGLFINV